MRCAMWPSPPMPAIWPRTCIARLWSWIVCVLVTVIVSYLTKPKPDSELTGLVYGVTAIPHEAEVPLIHRPAFLGGGGRCGLRGAQYFVLVAQDW